MEFIYFRAMSRTSISIFCKNVDHGKKNDKKIATGNLYWTFTITETNICDNLLGYHLCIHKIPILYIYEYEMIMRVITVHVICNLNDL